MLMKNRVLFLVVLKEETFYSGEINAWHLVEGCYPFVPENETCMLSYRC